MELSPSRCKSNLRLGIRKLSSGSHMSPIDSKLRSSKILYIKDPKHYQSILKRRMDSQISIRLQNLTKVIQHSKDNWHRKIGTIYRSKSISNYPKMFSDAIPARPLKTREILDISIEDFRYANAPSPSKSHTPKDISYIGNTSMMKPSTPHSLIEKLESLESYSTRFTQLIRKDSEINKVRKKTRKVVMCKINRSNCSFT
jgi:hypothetical protein